MQIIHEIGQPICRRLYHYPLMVFREELADVGLTVRYFTSPLEPGVENCDILIFHEDNYRDLLPIKTKVRAAALDFLEGFFEKFPRVIWFDDNDASGWLRNYMFPLVDVYAKPQVMKDARYYQEIHKTGDMHRDFVHERDYVRENDQVREPRQFKGVITDGDLGKIRIAWNIALKNWSYFNTHFPLVMKMVNHYSKGYRIPFTAPDLPNRGKIIPYRVRYWERNPAITWWRKKTEEKLVEVVRQHPTYRLASGGIANRWRYNAEMRRALVTVSPFGIGEVCYRDFESFCHGSLLFKARMDHLRTWPDIYVDGVTYISHAWDFSDFEDKLSDILRNPRRYEEVAREGQERFRRVLSDGPAFAEHVKAMVN